jgi:hypothetical protein
MPKRNSAPTHFFVGRRELDRIRKKICDDLSQPIRVGVHVAVTRCGVELNVYALTLGESAIVLYRLLHQ